MTICNREPGDILAEIRMMHTTKSHSEYWLVEGASDIRFFTPRVRGSIHLIDCTGKYKLIGAMRLRETLSNMRSISTLGIVDNDYDWLTGAELPADIISTEPRDLEGILLRANTIDCILSEFSSKEKIQAFEAQSGTSVVDAVLSKALIFGKIRAVNSLHYKKCLKTFKPIQFCNNDWTYNEAEAIKKAVSLGVSKSPNELIDLISKLPDKDPWHYIRGHDAVDILCGGLIHKLGLKKGISIANIEPILRQSFSNEHLSNTVLYRDTTKWHTDRGLSNPFRD